MPGRWIIFDADNTLWPLEPIYDRARERLCAFLGRYGVSGVEAEVFQQARDHALHATYGYSACRFPRSFEDTLLHFAPAAPPADVREVRGMAMAVFDERVEPAEGLEGVLRELGGAFRLAVITAGERWVQERRLSDFRLKHHFRAIEIVPAKTGEVFRGFCERHGAAPAATWMVGDSVNSDVRPALEAGLRPVLVAATNWERVEGAGRAVPSGVPTIWNLRELPSVIRKGEETGASGGTGA